MNTPSRRDFMKLAAGASVAAMALRNPTWLDAYPLGLPLGLQLYSVREQLSKDFEGTLKGIAAAGYTEVEAAGYYSLSAEDFKQSMTTAGLKCVSGHYPLDMLLPNLDNVLNYAKQLGLQYVVCSSPSLKDPSKVKVPRNDPTFHEAWINAFAVDDWKWNADQFNQIGKRTKAEGMQFGYHNHTAEFHKIGKTVPYDVLMQSTDPQLVTFEMDCGWVVRSGFSPVELLNKYPTRISMLHVKDFDLKTDPEHPKSAELGRGSIDYKPIFEAAKKAGHLTHYFVEQEEFDIPPLEALKVDAEYLAAMKL